MDLAWLGRNLDELAVRTLDHVVMTVLAVVIGSVISFGLALLIRRRRSLHGPIVAVSGTLYAIPSLALFAILIPFTGPQSLLAAEIALVSYTILILVRNFLAGFEGVPADVMEAADGMGLSSSQRLWRVELPIALPVIVAGMRIATVTVIGLVTVTALIGLGGLGYVIIELGYRRFNLTATIAGTLGAILLAVLADRAFVLLQRALTPWAARRTAT
ncbi:MAG: ABC transporter permease [Candidatus Limnocylindria bacterium]